LVKTEHLGQLQETLLTFSFAFPFAQKSIPVRFELLKVGQLGHKHNFRFSSLSGTDITVLPQGNYFVKS
jgi:hypothetical protein